MGNLQLCVEQDAVCEAGVNAIRSIFSDENSEAVLLVDALDAFNSINCQAAFRNVSILCPIIAPFLINVYHSLSKLFIGGANILSPEGIQGDPLGMVIFAIGTLPLICQIQGGVQQAWYADDANAGGTLTSLRGWWVHNLAIGQIPAKLG